MGFGVEGCQCALVAWWLGGTVQGFQGLVRRVWDIPGGSYPTPFLGRLLFKIIDPNHKTRYPKKGVGYEPLGRLHAGFGISGVKAELYGGDESMPLRKVKATKTTPTSRTLVLRISVPKQRGLIEGPKLSQ